MADPSYLAQDYTAVVFDPGYHDQTYALLQQLVEACGAVSRIKAPTHLRDLRKCRDMITAKISELEKKDVPSTLLMAGEAALTVLTEHCSLHISDSEDIECVLLGRLVSVEVMAILAATCHCLRQVVRASVLTVNADEQYWSRAHHGNSGSALVCRGGPRMLASNFPNLKQLVLDRLPLRGLATLMQGASELTHLQVLGLNFQPDHGASLLYQTRHWFGGEGGGYGGGHPGHPVDLPLANYLLTQQCAVEQTHRESYIRVLANGVHVLRSLKALELSLMYLPLITRSDMPAELWGRLMDSLAPTAALWMLVLQFGSEALVSADVDKVTALVEAGADIHWANHYGHALQSCWHGEPTTPLEFLCAGPAEFWCMSDDRQQWKYMRKKAQDWQLVLRIILELLDAGARTNGFYDLEQELARSRHGPHQLFFRTEHCAALLASRDLTSARGFHIERSTAPDDYGRFAWNPIPASR